MQSCISRVIHLWRNLEVNFHLFHHLPKAINTHKQTLSCWSITWQNVPVHVTALVVSIYSLYTMYNVTDTLYDDQPEQTVETVLFNTKRWTCLKSQSLQIHKFSFAKYSMYMCTFCLVYQMMVDNKNLHVWETYIVWIFCIKFTWNLLKFIIVCAGLRTINVKTLLILISEEKYLSYFLFNTKEKR